MGIVRLEKKRVQPINEVNEVGRDHRSQLFFWLSISLPIAFFITVTTAVMIGAVQINPVTVWEITLSRTPFIGDWISQDWNTVYGQIIWGIRLPRVLLGAIVGAGLAIVGVSIQALVRNSLADPFILGVSSGASVGATLVILFGAFQLFGQYALSVTAFLGALISMVLVYFISRIRNKITTTRLLLAGVAVSMMLGAATNYIVISSPNEEGMKDAMFWMMGSLAGARWDQLMIPAIVVVTGMLCLFIQYRPLNMLLMGEEAASTLGVNIESFRKFLILLTALLTGVIVAVSGAIGFIGLMIPHIVRVMVGSDHRRVLPISALLGAIFMIWADIGARVLAAPEELPVGIITALCGGPFFIWLLRRGSYSFGGERD
ncbi:FecCD family ABC transporter permease [Pseudalkalibacillus decolorationis]|uniref:FecCD family ABC transporter permease n=1 Tax=Pseudalkalibacillus decolorationis TaxID=163879 RepID=UPI002147AD3C|nr:iron ABC transporter permease [Pseudalkalibacillus decolorationis]